MALSTKAEDTHAFVIPLLGIHLAEMPTHEQETYANRFTPVLFVKAPNYKLKYPSTVEWMECDTCTARTTIKQ